MRVIDPGHFYELDVLDAPDLGRPFAVAGVRLRFVKREGPGYPGNVGHHPGTNLQEVLRALIDRVKYLDNQIHDSRNMLMIGHLRAALTQLELRAAERHGRSFDPILVSVEIEHEPTCPKCGHIGCAGECH